MPGLSIAVLVVMIGVLIWFERAHRRDRKAAAQWQTLSKISAVLGEILHEHTKLEDVLRLLVPTFADWSTLHLLEDGGVRRAAVVHADPELEHELRKRLSEVPFVRDAPLGPAKVLRTGDADLLHHRRAQILAGQLDPDLLERAGIGSRISVPLRARQQIIGALTIHRRTVGAYDKDDIAWAQELARLIALAIENTRLYADVRRLFEQSASANWVTREDGRILACNQMFAQLLGFASIDEVMRTSAMDVYATASERQALIDDVKRQGRVIGREMMFRRHDNGHRVFAAVHVFGDFDDHGELLKLTGFLVDRSAQKDLEEQLRQSQRLEAVGQLAGGIAHDFNNLLTVIIGCADLMALAGDRPAIEGGHDPLDELTGAARRAASLTQQLLAFSRRQLLQPCLVNLNNALRGIHGMLRRLVRESVTIELELDPWIPHVRVDPGQIDQVIVNLVVNSAYALSDGGTISLTTGMIEIPQSDNLRPYVLPGHYVSLVVKDNGSGMDEGTRARAFEPFFTTKPVGKGTGLGLSTVYGIIKQSGGYVWIDSEIGAGTAVTICFEAASERV
jgi:PAS domain S-box-containing protein